MGKKAQEKQQERSFQKIGSNLSSLYGRLELGARSRLEIPQQSYGVIATHFLGKKAQEKEQERLFQKIGSNLSSLYGVLKLGIGRRLDIPQQSHGVIATHFLVKKPRKTTRTLIPKNRKQSQLALWCVKARSIEQARDCFEKFLSGLFSFF